MEERNTVKFKKDEFSIRESVKKDLGKGKVSKVKIEYTPVGEKIIVSTHKPGLVIGRKGVKIGELTELLKTKYKFENPRIEIDEIKTPEFDAQIMADEIALSLERFGPIRFKVTAYRTLQKIINAGALGVEIRLNGKLPGARAKSWRFAQGYLKKTGDSAKVVDRAQARAETKPGTVGVKVAILSPHAILKDKININDEMIEELKNNTEELEKELAREEIRKGKKITNKSIKKKTTSKEAIKVENKEENEI
jgi:small subunit ribosomal protein S3